MIDGIKKFLDIKKYTNYKLAFIHTVYDFFC